MAVCFSICITNQSAQDASLGGLMELPKSFFGMGACGDANLLTKNGAYAINTSTGNKSTNVPTDWGILIMLNSYSTQDYGKAKMQIVIGADNHVYCRLYWDHTWLSWLTLK